MSNIYAHNTESSLKTLIEQVNSGAYVLPQFQRSFVWDPRDIKKLLVSIVKNFPAGSILQIRHSSDDRFATRPFENVDNPPKEAEYMILDGQQRLTSLHNALYGAGKHIFFIDVSKLIEGEDIEDAIFSLPNNQKNKKLLADTTKQISELRLPISTFINGSIRDWIDSAAEFFAERENEETENNGEKLRLEKIQRNKLLDIIDPIEKAIFGYGFPVYSLADDSSIEAICIIFETLNNTGVRLGVFDLLNARFHSQKIHLRELWEEAQRSHKYPILKEFKIDPYQLLQSICALTSPSPSVTRKAVLDLRIDKATFEELWNTVCKSMADSLRMLQNECGVLSHKWLPYSTILVTLATVVHDFPIDQGVGSAKNIEVLKKWFWISCFEQRYQQSPITQISNDIPKLKEWIVSGNDYLKLDDDKVSEEVIRNTTQSQRAVYRATMCAIVSNGSKDFYTGKQIISSNTKEQKFPDDHHIFPRAFFKDKGINRDKIDCIINRTLIDTNTNRSIGDNAPSQYLAKIKNAQGNSISGQTFHSHLIDNEALAKLQNDDFEEFCNIRVRLIRNRVKVLTD